MKPSLLCKIFGVLSMKSDIKILLLCTEQSEAAHSAFRDIMDLLPESEDRTNLKTLYIPKITRKISSKQIAF